MLDMDWEMAFGSKSPSTAWSDVEDVIVFRGNDGGGVGEKNAALFIFVVVVNDL